MPSDPRDYKLDLSSASLPKSAPTPSTTSRPFLSLLFACCNVYSRVYRSPDARSYSGRCPRCGVPVRIAIGSGGTDSRFFIVE